MSGIKLDYEIKDKAVLGMLARLDDFNKVAMFDDIGDYLVSETSRRFAAGEDWQGNALIQSQRAIEEGGRTLIHRGHLLDSYTHNTFADGAGVVHGSNMVYAAIHQFGGETGSKKGRFEMDARPVLGINDDDEAEIALIIKDHLREALDA